MSRLLALQLLLLLPFAASTPLHLCYAFFGPVNDFGWTYAQNVARAWVNAELGTTSHYVENFMFGYDDAGKRKVLDGFINSGCKVVFTGSVTFSVLTMEYANKYPATTFVGLGSFLSSSNFAKAYIRIYQGNYIAGMVAAMQPGVKRLGYIGSVYIPDSMRDVNAFTLGARSVDPSIKVSVIYTGSWYDRRKERIAGLRLYYNHGADLVSYDSDSDEVCKLASEEPGKFSIGKKSDCTVTHGESNLLSVVPVWQDIFLHLVKAVQTGNWSTARTEMEFVGFETDAISMGTSSQKIPVATIFKIQQAIKEFKKGNDLTFCPNGPMTDTKGVQHTPANGACFDAGELHGMNWFVEGVEDLGMLKLPDSCPPGTKVNATAAQLCISCPPGTFSDEKDAKECTPCRPGSHSGKPNATRCLPCPAGYLSQAAGATSCGLCPPGRFSDGGQDTCTGCQPGTFRDAGSLGAARVSCQRCAQGSYAAAEGSANCTACRGSLTTDGRGAVAPGDCLCPRGTFRPLDDAAGRCEDCGPRYLSCPLGADMENWRQHQQNPAATLQPFPQPEPGFWSSTSDPISVFRCRSERACPGGRPGTCGPHRRSARSCEECAEGYGNMRGECTECTDSYVALLPLMMAAAPFAIYIAYFLFNFPIERADRRVRGVSNSLFVLLMYVQQLAMFSKFNINLPAGFEQTSQVATVALFDVDLLMPACSIFSGGSLGFVEAFVFAACIPIIALAYFALVYLASVLLVPLMPKLTSRRKFLDNTPFKLEKLNNLFFSLINSIFIALSTQSTGLLNCHKNPNDTESLHSHLQVLCWESSEWHSMVPVAVVSFLVYTVGVAALFAWINYIAPQRFNDERFRARWLFLLEKFRPDRWWWDWLHLAKALCLSVSVFFRDGRNQLVWTFCVLLVYTSCCFRSWPWRHHVVNVIDVAQSLALTVIVVMSLARGAGDLDSKATSSSSELDQLVMVVAAVPILVFLWICGLYGRHRYGNRNKRNMHHTEQLQAGAMAQWVLRRVLCMDMAQWNKLITLLSDHDREHLDYVVRALAAEGLGVHISSRWAHQRLALATTGSKLQPLRRGASILQEHGETWGSRMVGKVDSEGASEVHPRWRADCELLQGLRARVEAGAERPCGALEAWVRRMEGPARRVDRQTFAREVQGLWPGLEERAAEHLWDIFDCRSWKRVGLREKGVMGSWIVDTLLEHTQGSEPASKHAEGAKGMKPCPPAEAPRSAWYHDTLEGPLQGGADDYMNAVPSECSTSCPPTEPRRGASKTRPLTACDLDELDEPGDLV